MPGALGGPPRAGVMPPPRPLRLLAPAIGAVILIAAHMHLLAPLTAVVASVGTVVAVYAGLLIRLALGIHRRRRSFGHCRGAGFLGMGVLVSGLTVAVAAARPGAARSSELAAGGLLIVVVMYLLGLLFLPGTAPTLGARLRRGLDGVGVGACLLFTAWVLVIYPYGGDGLVLIASMTAAVAVAVAVVTGLGAVRYRPAALACAGGAILSMVGLAAFAILIDAAPSRAVLTWITMALLAGPILTWAGARRAGTGPRQPEGPDSAGSLAGYPLLILPAVAAMVAAAYHFLAAGAFDPISVLLGIIVVATMTTREALAAGDVRRYARRLKLQAAQFRLLVADSSDVTLVLDSDLTVRWQSPAAARQFGLSDQDVLDRPLTALIHAEDAGRVARLLTPADRGEPVTVVEARLRDGFGAWRYTELTVRDQHRNPDVDGLVVHIRDIGERTEMRRTLRRLESTDRLTGLPNRERLGRTVDDLCRQNDTRGTLVLVDLDGVAGVNGVRGHDIGDAILIEAARRLRAGVNEADLPARLDGHEFAVVTARGAIAAYGLATRLVTVLTEPYELPGTRFRLSASAGLADLSGLVGVDEALRRAGIALCQARQLGRCRVECYDESMEAALLRRTELEQQLPGAVSRGELDLAYQPVLELAQQQPVGVESLLRWRHPQLGTVAPADLVPVAENLGVIDEVGDWIINRSCRQLSQWLRDGRRLWMAVNVSSRQLTAPGFVDTVRSALETHQVPAELLVLELAEHGVGSDLPPVAAQLSGVRALGVRVALDHFGSGPTSLAYLRRLPVDILKIDRAVFADPPGVAATAAPILDVVIRLGDRLGLQTVATGLEAPAHLDVVRASGCRYGQGYLLARPAPAEHVEAYLDGFRTPFR
jgi:diguanylate cyclase (GGDEF)-like protein/PAS domain S-box-containing protein